MSSNIRLPKICIHCGDQFIARTTVTQFCSDRCAKAGYKQRMRRGKLTLAVNNEFYKSEGIILQDLKHKEFLSVKETCVLLGISRTSLYRYVERGLLPQLKIGSRVLIPREGINNLID
jgi:excisionase family DNA binding protein